MQSVIILTFVAKVTENDSGDVVGKVFTNNGDEVASVTWHYPESGALRLFHECFLNLTLYDTVPDGTSYALCTTLQYFGFKSAANTTALMVEPQSILMALLAIKVEIAEAFVNALIRLCKWVASAMMRLLTVLMEILKVEQLISRWCIDAIEVIGDFSLGVLAFARYLGSI